MWRYIMFGALVALPARGGEALHLKVDASRPGSVVSPRLFGHNIEITRRGSWQGLSAEMVANRKFAGAAKADGLPPRWYAVTGGGRVTTAAEGGFAGPQCLCIEAKAEHRATGIGQFGRSLGLEAGRRYEVSAWVRNETNQAAALIIRLTDAAGAVVFVEEREAVSAGDWTRVAQTFQAGSTVIDGRLELLVEGRGTLRVGAVSLRPTETFHGMRRDVVDLLKRLHPGIIRWPGGCFAEYYPWRDGLLEPDRRPPIGPAQLDFLLPQSDGYDAHEIGIDDYIALCREIGAEPAITVRLGDGSAEEAAAFVEYCNGAAETRWGKIRADRGHAEPYHVQTWWVGNEIYWSGHGGTTDPKVFVERSTEFAKAMKGVDPTIRLVGCAWLDPAQHDRWDAPLINTAGAWLDLASFHLYAGIDDDNQIAAKVRDANGVNHSRLSEIRHWLQGKPTPDGRVLGTSYDEWNLMWGRTPGDAPGALYAAGTLNLLVREADALGVDLACSFMPINEGCIEVRPHFARMNADGRVFELFSRHAGQRRLDVSPLGVDEDIDASASIGSTGKEIFITIVNRNVRQAVDVTIDLEGNGQVEAKGEVLTIEPRVLKRGAGIRERVAGYDGTSRTLTVPAGGISCVRLGEGRPLAVSEPTSPAPVLAAAMDFDEALKPDDSTRLVGAVKVVGDAGHERGGAVFNGERGFIDMGRALIDTTDSFSVAAWIRLEPGFESTFRTVVSQDSDTSSGFYLQTAPKQGDTGPVLRFTRWNGPDSASLLTATAAQAPVAGTWYHVAAVQDLDARVLRLYVNGELAAEEPMTGMNDSYRWEAGGHTVIGRGQFRGTEVDPFLGTIDGVRVYAGALNAEQVRGLAGRAP